ncbi:Predicted sulfurtransferase [Enterococcus faecalis]|nr:Predicted sulfurtransferase [Enterococcus faecalis]
MYVFDDRISVEINHVDKKVIGKDWFDGTPCERYINCANPECNRQILTSEENEHKHLGGCSLECSQHPANRYVKKYNLTEAEVAERLALLEAVEV